MTAEDKIAKGRIAAVRAAGEQQQDLRLSSELTLCCYAYAMRRRLKLIRKSLVQQVNTTR